MIRAVLDSNVLVSGIVQRHPDAPSVQLLDAWRAGRFQLITAEVILEEVAGVLSKPYFRTRLTEAQVERAMRAVRRHALVTPLTVDVRGVASHPADDLILAAAVSAGADYLATGEKALVSLGSFRNVTVMTPRAFLSLLNETAAR